MEEAFAGAVLPDSTKQYPKQPARFLPVSREREKERERERERGPSFSPYRSASLFCIPIVPSSLYDLALYVFILFYFVEFLCLLVDFRPFSWNSRLLGYRLITSSYTKKDSLERPLCCFLQTRSRTRAKRRWEAAAILGRSARETAAFGK